MSEDAALLSGSGSAVFGAVESFERSSSPTLLFPRATFVPFVAGLQTGPSDLWHG